MIDPPLFKAGDRVEYCQAGTYSKYPATVVRLLKGYVPRARRRTTSTPTPGAVHFYRIRLDAAGLYQLRDVAERNLRELA